MEHKDYSTLLEDLLSQKLWKDGQLFIIRYNALIIRNMDYE